MCVTQVSTTLISGSAPGCCLLRKLIGQWTYGGSPTLGLSIELLPYQFENLFTAFIKWLLALSLRWLTVGHALQISQNMPSDNCDYFARNVKWKSTKLRIIYLGPSRHCFHPHVSFSLSLIGYFTVDSNQQENFLRSAI